MYKTLKYILLLFITALICYSCESELLTENEKEWLKNTEEIKVAVFPYYPPYQFSLQKDSIEGILPEFLKLVEKKINYKFTKVYYTNWSSLLEDTRNKKIDIILEIQETDHRKKNLNFYPTTFESPFVLVVRNTDSVNKIADLKNKIITVPKSFSIDYYIRTNYPSLRVKNYDDDISSLRNVQNGNCDAYIGPKPLVHYLIRSENLTNLKIVDPINYSYTPSIAIQKDNHQLNSVFSKALNNISEPEKTSILDIWLFDVVKPFYKKSQFWIIFFITVSSIFMIISFLNFYLKFKIKQKTEELQISKDKAEESNRIKTNFIQNISHEIRTPMNGIIGFSELLKTNDITDQEQKEFAEIIINSGKELITSVDNILEISKLETTEIELIPEKTDLISLLNNLIAKYSIKANQKGLELTFENKIASEHNTVLLDKSKLIKILNNIIDNSIKFTNEGSISIISYIENDFIVFSIRDTGVGIKPNDQEIIFQSFSQSEKEISKNFGGLGLGLAIAKKNIDLMKGKVSFVSKLNKGSTFSIYIPFPYGK